MIISFAGLSTQNVDRSAGQDEHHATNKRFVFFPCIHFVYFFRIISSLPGLSPFTKRSESPFDCFGAGHSSTSISAGLGMAVARDMQGRSNHVIAVIGDGAITGGMAYEAMNNAGYLDTNMIIILNDNQQVSISYLAISSHVFSLMHYLRRFPCQRSTIV